MQLHENANKSIKLTARTVCGLSGKALGASAYTRRYICEAVFLCWGLLPKENQIPKGRQARNLSGKLMEDENLMRVKIVMGPAPSANVWQDFYAVLLGNVVAKQEFPCLSNPGCRYLAGLKGSYQLTALEEKNITNQLS